MKKEKVINIRGVQDVKIKTYDKGFTLDFWATDRNKNKYTVKIHFECWWVRILAKLLWESVKYQQAGVDRQSSALKGGG